MPRIFFASDGIKQPSWTGTVSSSPRSTKPKEAEWRGRDIAALDIRKGAAPSGGVIIIDDDLGMVRGLSFKQISNTL
jgi:hypothetical protein